MNQENRNFWASATRMVAFPGLVYFLIFCIFTYPSILRFHTHFFSDAGDGLQNVWNIWWINQAVTQLHQNPWYTTYLYYPNGTSLIGQTLNPFNGFLGIFLLKFFTLTQTYNFIVIFSFVMAGVTAFWLSFALTRSYPASLLAGYIFTFSQYHFTHAEGHLQLVSMEWIPLFVLCWIQLLARPSLRKAIAASLVLFAVILCDYYYFFYCVLAGVLIVVWYGITKKDARFFIKREYLLSFSGFLLASLVTSGVLVISLLRTSAQDPLSGAHDPHDFSLDLLAPWIPGGHWRFAQLTQGYWARLPGNIHESSVYLGVSVLFLLLYAWSQRKEARTRFASFFLWYAILLFFGVLALGPELQVAGKTVFSGIMPYTVLEAIFPQLKLSGVPVRMIVMTTLAAAVISAMGAILLFQKFPRQRALMTGVLGFFLLFDFLPKPIPLTRLDVPEHITRLKNTPADGGVLDRVTPNTIALYYQTIHGKPLIDGYISRSPKSVSAEANKKYRAFEQQDYLTLFKVYDVRYILTSSAISESACQARLNLLYGGPQAKLYEIERVTGNIDEVPPDSLQGTLDGLGAIDQYNGDKITGWAVIPDMDASASQISVLLVNGEHAWKIPVCRKNRVDISKQYNAEKLYDQSGYLAYLGYYEIPPGTYRIGVLVENGGQTAVLWGEEAFVSSK